MRYLYFFFLFIFSFGFFFLFFFQAEDGIRDLVRSRGLGDVYKRQHQSFVGVGYYDLVQKTIMHGTSSTAALVNSTEAAQF